MLPGIFLCVGSKSWKRALHFREDLYGDITHEQLDTKTRGYSVSGPDGAYYLPLLPPGRYRVKASCKDYQTREVYDVVVEVAGYVQIDFELRPLCDVWERGRYGTVTFRDQSLLPFGSRLNSGLPRVQRRPASC